MRNLFVFLIAFGFTVFAGFAFSADYYWMRYGSQTHFPSAQAACPQTNDLSYAKGKYIGFILSGNSGQCQYEMTSAYSTYVMTDYNITRLGESCSGGATYNVSTGGCDMPENKCELLKGTDIPAFKWSSNTDDPPSTLSINGCAASVTKARCSYVTTGKASCTGTATLTGSEMASDPKGTAESCEGSDCGAGELKTEKQNQECVYVSNSSGTSSCTAITSENNPGNSDCGSVNGEYKCIRNPKATSTTNKLESTKTEKSNTDGTLTTVKDNTLTTTKCVDSTCNSSVTKSNGTTTTDSNGNTVGQSSSCTGSNCNGKGETNGTGDSNKIGDEKGDEEGEEEGTDTPPVTPPTPPEKGNLDGEADVWDTKIADSKTELKEALGKIKESFSPVGELSLGGGGGGLYCPPPVQVMGASFDICLDKYQDKLSWIGSAIFAVFAVIAVLIIFN